MSKTCTSGTKLAMIDVDGTVMSTVPSLQSFEDLAVAAERAARVKLDLDADHSSGP